MEIKSSAKVWSSEIENLITETIIRSKLVSSRKSSSEMSEIVRSKKTAGTRRSKQVKQELNHLPIRHFPQILPPEISSSFCGYKDKTLPQRKDEDIEISHQNLRFNRLRAIHFKTWGNGERQLIHFDFHPI